MSICEITKDSQLYTCFFVHCIQSIQAASNSALQAASTLLKIGTQVEVP